MPKSDVRETQQSKARWAGQQKQPGEPTRIDMETKKEAVPQFPAQSRRHELLMSLWHLAGYKALSYIIWGLILTYGKLWIINPI